MLEFTDTEREGTLSLSLCIRTVYMLKFCGVVLVERFDFFIKHNAPRFIDF